MEENFGNTEPGEGPDGSGSSEGELRVDPDEELYTQRRRRLVAELRNGGRLQTTGRLQKVATGNSPGGFCCLGVACEVAMADGLGLTRPWPQEGQSFIYGFPGEMGSTTSLPEAARKWYGFMTQDPMLLVPQVLLDVVDVSIANQWGPEIMFRATALNDTYDFTLAQIGVCFQYTFLREDWEAERG